MTGNVMAQVGYIIGVHIDLFVELCQSVMAI